MTEQSPRERAAETKRRRTRDNLILSADALTQRDGLNVRAEDVAQQAGVSVATFYNVFPTRGAMFTETFNEVVAAPHRDALRAILEQTGVPGVNVAAYRVERGRLVDLLKALDAVLADRRELVRGALMARISEPPPRVGFLESLTSEANGDDPVRDLATRITHVLPYGDWTMPDGEVDSRRMVACFMAIEQTALFVLDEVANTGRVPLVESVADVLLGLFEVERTIFDRPKSERRGLNRHERAAIESTKARADKLLSEE